MSSMPTQPDQGQQGPRKRKDSTKFVFTEKRLAALQSQSGGAYYVFDTTQPALCVRVTATVKVYVFYKWFRGRPYRLTIGKVGQIQLREARLIVARYLGALATGEDVFSPARKAKQAGKPLTLQDAFDAHMARPDFGISTLRGYRSVWKRTPARLKSRPIPDIVPEELKPVHAQIGVRHKRTANKWINVVSTLLNRNGRRFDNPADSVERFREDVRARVLTVEELRRLRAGIRQKPRPWRDYFELLLLTGAGRWRRRNGLTSIWLPGCGVSLLAARRTTEQSPSRSRPMRSRY
jgi:hypothetical protein